MKTALVFVKLVISCCLRSLLPVAGEKVIFPARIRLYEIPLAQDTKTFISPSLFLLIKIY